MMDVLREKGEIHLLLHRFASKVNVTSGQIRFGQGCMSGLSFPKLPIVLCLLTLSGLTLGHGPTVIKVEGGADVVLPCSLSTKENIEFKFFDWRKVAQKDDGPKKVFMYDGGIHYNNGLDGQSEEFKGRVSHFPDELKHGDASIIIRNTKISDSGDYRCYFPRLQPPQTFPIKLVVGAGLKPSLTLQGLTIFSALLQCEVHGNPKPKVELQDSDGNNLDAKVTQVSEREGSFYITLQTKVTKTGTYRCVATQEEIKHQIYAETSVYISGFSGWIAAAVIGVLFLVAGVILAVYILYRRKKEPKLITVEEGSDVILPCSVWPEKNLRSTKFVWKKTDDNVFLYDNGEHPGQSEQFKGRVSHFPDELEQGNASIIISNTTRADSGEYRCIIPLIHKQQKFQINVVVGTEVIKVEEGSDVTLPCSLWPKEDIRLTRFIWKKMPQNDESQMEVFLYDEGDLYSDERPGQSEKFKGRVSHFPDELKQGNASITIRNMTRADSGDYRCSFPLIQKHKKFHIKLIVEPKLITVEEGSDVTLPCSLWPKEDIRSTRFVWRKNYDGQMVFLYDKDDLYSDERPSCKFQGRVSHFPDKLEQGNASITIRNTTRADSGDYRCSFPKIRKPKKFHIKLIVGPKVIKVEEGGDVILPCSLWPKKDLRSTQFIWKKVSEKTDDGQKVFLYDKGDLYSDEHPGQSEQFKGRVSLFPDKLKQGNASIIIRNAMRADSGDYRCYFPSIQRPQMFYIKLDVEPTVITAEEGSDVTLPCSLWPKEDIQLTRFIWKKVSQKTDDVQNVFLYDKGDLYSDERPDQSEQFKGRVSHFPDELKQGNASIIIRNTTRADSGEYRLIHSFILKHQKVHITLVVGPKLITVEEGSDVTLPCSLWTKEDITSTQFVWETTGDGQKVFLYDKGDLYSDERPGQSEQFKGRVSHFPDVLKQGNASIIIRNTRRADSGVYRCIVPSLQKHQMFHIKLVVGPKVIKVEEGVDVTLPCSLWPKEDITSTRFVWIKTDDDQEVFLYDNGDLYSDERPGQSEKFKGRVSHFPDELEQGNASIIISNTTRDDSGEYRCIVPFIQKHQLFHIKLVVVGPTPEPDEHHPLMTE